MSITSVPCQNRQKPGSKNVPLAGGVAAAITKRATVQPGVIHPSGGKKLREKGQLRIRRGAGFVIPANMNPPARRVHRKRLQLLPTYRKFHPTRLTHLVKTSIQFKPALSLQFTMISGFQLPKIG